MNTSKELDKLFEALDKFHEASSLVKAEKDNPFFKSKYAPFNEVVSKTRKHLIDSDLRVKQGITNVDGKTAIWTRLTHLTTNQFIETISPVVHKEHDPQAQGSGITYMKRYSYIAILDILVDTDDDGNVGKGLQESADKTKKIDEAVEKIESAKTLEDLQKIFQGLGRLIIDPKIIAAKNTKKEELKESQI